VNPLEWIDYELYGNTLLVWASGIGLFILVWSALALVRRLLRGRLGKLAKTRDLTVLNVAEFTVSKTRSWFLVLTAFFIGSRLWLLPEAVDVRFWQGFTIVLLVQSGIWATAATLRFLDIRRKEELDDNRGMVAAMDVLSFVARVIIWSIVLLLMLDNLGVDITALVAGLGVGGIAVALAAQNILGDLFASLSIVLDKPFVVGDFLIIGDFLGTVEKVGIKTTRVRSLSGEQLIFSNNDLLSSRIRNYGRMYERRVVFQIGITYQTPADKLAKASEILRAAVEKQDDVRFDRAHFQKYGDFALIYEIVYYVLSPDYNRYMDIQQAVNIEIYERFAEAGLEFAYPTQTLYLTRNASESSGKSES
jgi:small-conductance mechanosensitive channel